MAMVTFLHDSLGNEVECAGIPEFEGIQHDVRLMGDEEATTLH
jgi:hypothetical protein